MLFFKERNSTYDSFLQHKVYLFINWKEQVKLLLEAIQFIVSYLYLISEMTEELPKKIIHKFNLWQISLFKQEYENNFS